jgi:immunoglobulin-like protein involved in spore germination
MYRNGGLIVVVTAALLAACGSDESGGATTTSEVVVTTTQPAATTTTTQPAVTTTTTATQPVVTTTLPEPARPAIWPVADVVFDTPEAAAADFLAKVFGDGPVLGEFRAADSRSGEIEVFASAEGVPLTVARSVLLLRQLGPSDGWFVFAAVNDHATVSLPESGSVVPAGPLTIEGVARGFEATIVVSAFVAGRADVEFGREVTMAGNFEEALPYSVVLDLTDASPGDIVVLLVRGGTGLETDPGDFGAIPVVVGN